MSSSQQTNLPLPQYYAKTLQSLLPIFDDSLPLSEPSTQAQLAKATDDLYLISRMLTSLGVFSDNEGLDELGDRELVFMTVPWVLGEAEAKGGLGGYPDRIAALRRSDTAFNAFLGLLQTYNVFGSDEQAEGSSSTAPGAVPSDPGQRREAKIRAYRREKELKERISVSTELRLLQTLTKARPRFRATQSRRPAHWRLSFRCCPTRPVHPRHQSTRRSPTCATPASRSCSCCIRSLRRHWATLPWS